MQSMIFYLLIFRFILSELQKLTNTFSAKNMSYNYSKNWKYVFYKLLPIWSRTKEWWSKSRFKQYFHCYTLLRPISYQWPCCKPLTLPQASHLSRCLHSLSRVTTWSIFKKVSTIQNQKQYILYEQQTHAHY